jgi:quercetin dioxygenase-like cupin family protein
MLTRRLFASCAICSAAGLLASSAEAQAPGFTRTMLQRMDGPADGYATILVRVDLQPEGFIAWHTHPGIETGMILTGGGTLSVKGQPDRVVAAGDSFQVPVETPHALRGGAAASTIEATYIVENGKPLATLVPAPA